MKQNEIVAASIIAVLLTPALSIQNAKAQSLPGVPSARQDKTINIQQMIQDFLGSDPELNKDFTIKTEGANKQYTRIVTGSPAEMQATLPASEQIKAIDEQIQATQANIKRLKEAPAKFAQVPVEFSNINLLLVLPMDSSISSPSIQQLLDMVRNRTAVLEAQLADARKELADTQTRKKDVPIEFIEVANAIVYMANEKVSLIQRQIADIQKDSAYIRGSVSHSDAADLQSIIDRKVALFNQNIIFLTKRTKLLQGQDPRP